MFKIFFYIVQKIFLWLIVLFCVLVIVSVLFIRFKSRPLVQEKLQSFFNRPVKISDIKVLSPIDFYVDYIEIDGILEMKQVKFSFGFPDFKNKRITLSKIEIENPFLVIHKMPDARFVISHQMPTKTEESTEPQWEESKKREKSYGIFIKQISVRNGQVQYFDHSFNKPFDLIFAEMHLKANAWSLPEVSLKTTYSFESTIFGSSIPFSGDQLKSRGWINFKEKNMDSRVDIIGSKNETVLTLDLKSEQNDLTVNGKLNTKSLAQKEPIDLKNSKVNSFDEILFQGMLLAAMGTFQSPDLDLELKFSFKTKMDKFEINNISFSGVDLTNQENKSASPTLDQKIEDKKAK